MKLVDMKCPHCGADLKIDSDKEQAFCEHCGARLFVDDEVRHIQYDNAEQAGYEFEKGRQRAQREMQMSQSAPVYRQTNNTGYVQQIKRRTWLWVLGWICIFPVPLTIILVRKKDMNLLLKIAIIAVAWIVYFAIGASA